MAAFPLFGRPLPIHFALLGRKQKYIKSKTTAKLREKPTSIAVVRAKLGQFDTFQTPLLSHCRLPLNMHIRIRGDQIFTVSCRTGTGTSLSPTYFTK